MRHRIPSIASLLTFSLSLGFICSFPASPALGADDEPFTVVSMDPAPGAVLPWAPGSILFRFSHDVMPESANNKSMRVSRIHDDGQATPITGIVNVGRLRHSVRVGLPELSAGLYEIRIRGDVDAQNRMDAELLALEQSRGLLPSPRLFDRVYQDLTAIRAFDPLMTGVIHQGYWAPGVVLIRLTPAAREMFEAGRHRRLDVLNKLLGAVEIRNFSGDWFRIRFAERYSPYTLARIYLRVRGVEFAEPDWGIWLESWIYAEPQRYTFSIGSGDCWSGCINRHTWSFLVEDGVVTLLDMRLRGALPPNFPPYLFDSAGDILQGNVPGDPPSSDASRGSDFVARFTVASGN